MKRTSDSPAYVATTRAVAAVIAAPFTLFGAGRAPGATAAPADGICRMVPPPAGGTGPSAIGRIVAAHLPLDIFVD